MTLLDYPEKAACTVFLCGCNFRCPFCHNASLVTHTEDAGAIEEDEFWKFLKKRQGILDGVCVTGGEPLLRDGMEEFLAKIKELGYLVKLDTNGSFPGKLRKLVEAGLVDYVAMDIKNCREKYAQTAGIQDVDMQAIEESVAYLMEGHVPYEFRTTIVREFHQKDDFDRLGKWISGAEKYYLQKFEDSQDLIKQGLHGYDDGIMRQALEIVKKYVEHAYLRGIS